MNQVCETQESPLTAYAGHLAKHTVTWRRITSDPWVLETISGYHLEFENEVIPVQSHLPNPPMLNQHEECIMNNEIQKLIAKGAIERVNHCPGQFISNMFLVPKKTGDLRPVINLKPLNEFVAKIHFKMEGIHLVQDLIQPGDYLATIDLKDAYFSIPIFPRDRIFFRFLWDEKLYEFTCLPFGYSLAPRVFTKVLKPVMATLHCQGIRTITFIDDTLVIASSAEECFNNISTSTNLLENLGFQVNYDKSVLTPSQSISYLGFIIDTVTGTLSLPESKITKIILACQDLLKLQKVTLCDIAHVTGLLVSAFPAVRYLELYYKSIEYCKSHQLHLGSHFDDTASLSKQAKQDLNWIICHIKSYNGKSFRDLPIDLVLECDASNSGWGAACNGMNSHGPWSLEESEHHINFKELLAAFFAVQAFYPLHRNVHHIRLKIDNSTAVANINNYGSIKSPALNQLSREFWEWCLQREIHLSAESIAGIDNCIADSLSRRENSRLEWCLNDQIFHSVCEMTFHPNLDLFASRLNAKVPLFVSWHPEPGCHSVDAFNLCWTSYQCYAFPPFCLIGRVLSKLQRDNVHPFLLIAPIWPTQTWYPALLNLSVMKPILLPVLNNLLYLVNKPTLHPLRNKLRLAAWILSANISKREAFLNKQPNCYVHPGQRAQKSNIDLPGTNGVAGVVKNKLIHFKQLQNR